MDSQKSGPLDWFQCAELSDHKREAWSTQTPTVLGDTAWRSILVPLWEVRCLADWALHPNRESVSTRCVRSATPRPLEMTEPGQGAAHRNLHGVEVWNAFPNSRRPKHNDLSDR